MGKIISIQHKFSKLTGQSLQLYLITKEKTIVTMLLALHLFVHPVTRGMCSMN